MQLDLFSQQYQGTLAAGADITLNALEYMVLLTGSGLQIAGRGRGTPVDLNPYTVLGDGRGAIGTVRLYNPTGGTVTYKLVTSSVRLDPSALSATASVNALCTGAAANGAATSGNPVLVAGSDGGNVRTLATTTGGVLRTAPEASTLGGATRLRARSAASTNATSVKASAAKLYGFTVSNTNPAARFLKLFDLAVAPTVGTSTPAATVLVPAGATVHVDIAVGEAFATGLAYCMTVGEADTDVAAVGAGDLHLVLRYA